MKYFKNENFQRFLVLQLQKKVDSNLWINALNVICALTLLGAVACGVKGDPVAPASPAELGRGQPTFKKATQEFAFPDVPPIYEDSEKSEESNKSKW